MKKFFAMLLAAMMLLSCVSAMASALPTPRPYYDPDTDTVQVDAFNITFEDTDATDSFDAKHQTSGDIGTELWLQVSAQGQIDVTVPLALVFATNIDGGESEGPTTYGITNHSTADLKVTKIEFVESTPATNPLKLVKTVTEGQVDTYEGYLQVGTAKYEFNRGDTDETYGFYSSIQKDEDHTSPRYVKDATDTNLNQLFELESAYAGDNTAGDVKTGLKTEIKTFMKTSRLSFVTQQVDNGNNDTTAKENTGVQLMTIVYTVAVDDNDYAAGNITIKHDGDIPTDATSDSEETTGAAATNP